MSHTNPLPELTGVQAFQNTDREVWRETPGDFYSNSVHLTATGGLGINVGGTVYVKPPAEWHRLASGARSTALVALAPEVDDALREVGKWLNEQPNRPIDRVAVAVLCAALSCSTAAQPAAWDGAEEWEQLAWQLCAEENGEDACTELVWEGGATPATTRRRKASLLPPERAMDDAPKSQDVKKFDDVLLPVLELMRAELHANTGKGDRPGWLAMSREQAALEVYHHAAKLAKAMRNDDATGISEYSADVANMAMMALDVCGYLPAPQDVNQAAALRGEPEAAGQDWRRAVALAYGHLWHVNNEPMAPVPLRRPETAAYAARKVLRDLLTNEERGEAINAVRALLASEPPQAASGCSHTARPDGAKE